MQSFLVANQEPLRRLGWEWPRGVDGQTAGPKSFANLVGALANRSCRDGFWRNAPTLTDAILSVCHGTPSEKVVKRGPPATLLRIFRAEFLRIANAGRNLILSAEDLAYLDGDAGLGARARAVLLDDLLAPFRGRVTAVLVYRTPRASALQSVYTEEVDWARDGIETAYDAHATFSAWLSQRLHAGNLLCKPPWSSSLNPGRLADAFAWTGFDVRVISSSGARRAGLDVSDVLACEVMGVACECGRAQSWSLYKAARTYETQFHGVAHGMAAALPRLMQTAGCDPPRRGTYADARPSVQEAEELASRHGAALRCSDLHGADELLGAFDAAHLLGRYSERMLHWEAAAEARERTTRQYCELDLNSDATWAALRRSAEARGYNCGDGRDFNSWAASAKAAAARSHAQPATYDLEEVPQHPHQRQRQQSQGKGRQQQQQRSDAEEASAKEPSDSEVRLAAAVDQPPPVGPRTILDRLQRGCDPAKICSMQIQSVARAVAVANERTPLAHAWPPRCSPPLNASSASSASSAPPPRVAYVLLTSPFRRDAGRGQGPVQQGDVLRMHLLALGATSALLSRLLLMVPSESSRGAGWEARVAGGYLDILPEASRLPFPATLIRVPNNTLGSYGMFLSAYAMRRDQFAYYIFSEDDYLPVRPYFDRTLVELFSQTFGRRAGMLSGLLQGKPVEPTSPYELHLESSLITSAATLRRLFRLSAAASKEHPIERALELLAQEGVCTSEMKADRPSCTQVVDARFDRIQLAFGALLRNAGVEALDWTSAFRTPYWDHQSIVDWSGASHGFNVPAERVLIAPVQWPFADQARICCTPWDCIYLKQPGGQSSRSCTLARGATPLQESDCCGQFGSEGEYSEQLRVRRQTSVTPSAHSAQAAQSTGNGNRCFLTKEVLAVGGRTSLS